MVLSAPSVVHRPRCLPLLILRSSCGKLKNTLAHEEAIWFLIHKMIRRYSAILSNRCSKESTKIFGLLDRLEGLDRLALHHQETFKPNPQGQPVKLQAEDNRLLLL